MYRKTGQCIDFVFFWLWSAVRGSGWRYINEPVNIDRTFAEIYCENIRSIITGITVLCFCVYIATAYGKGVYFARSFDYSAQYQYSPPNEVGNKYIFQCRVLTGHFHLGHPLLVEPPVRDRNTLALYNSVVDCLATPGIFVVFHDTQVYPEYLITFCQI